MLDILLRNIRPLGYLAIVISLVTWWIDLAGLVNECVYCRTQRTAIGLVGLLMILPDPRKWWIRYVAAAICFLGASVAADQLFLIIRAVNAAKAFSWLNLVLATGALFMLIGQAFLIFSPARPRSTEHNPQENSDRVFRV